MNKHLCCFIDVIGSYCIHEIYWLFRMKGYSLVATESLLPQCSEVEIQGDTANFP